MINYNSQITPKNDTLYISFDHKFNNLKHLLKQWLFLTMILKVKPNGVDM